MLEYIRQSLGAKTLPFDNSCSLIARIGGVSSRKTGTDEIPQRSYSDDSCTHCDAIE